MLENKQQLSVRDTVSLIVGIVIGAGIFETAPLIFATVSSASTSMAVWAVGGFLSLIGALCYAELATAYPKSGGDYVYLSRAYGSWMGFLFGWAQLAVILTGSIGMMAYIFADYAVALWGFAASAATRLSILAVLALSTVNWLGIVAGKRMQNVLSLAKVVGLALVIFSGITAFWDGSANSTLSNISVSAIGDTPGAIGLALVIVLYTFGGWNDAAFVAAEVKNPRKGISRSLIIGTAVITFVYLVVNLSYLSGLGFERAKFSTAIAADLLRLRFGEVGAALMSILVMVAALGAVNGLILTGSRVCAALGEDHRVFSRLGQWHPRTGAPIWAIAAQGFVSVALILLVGTDAGRTFIGWGIHSLGIPSPTNWEGRGGFDTLLKSTAPVFWLFFLLTGLSLFILRRRDPDVERPFRVPFYPITPIIFCLTSAYMLYRSVIYAGGLTLVGLLLLAIGLPLFWFSRRTPSIVPKFEPA